MSEFMFDPMPDDSAEEYCIPVVFLLDRSDGMIRHEMERWQEELSRIREVIDQLRNCEQPCTFGFPPLAQCTVPTPIFVGGRRDFCRARGSRRRRPSPAPAAHGAAMDAGGAHAAIARLRSAINEKKLLYLPASPPIAPRSAGNIL